MWVIGVEVEQETGAPPPKKNPGSAPAMVIMSKKTICFDKKPSVERTDLTFNMRHSVQYPVKLKMK